MIDLPETPLGEEWSREYAKRLGAGKVYTVGGEPQRAPVGKGLGSRCASKLRRIPSYRAKVTE